MSDWVVINVRIADEHIEAPDATIVQLDLDDWCAKGNELLAALPFPAPVMILTGASLEPGWTTPMELALRKATFASPVLSFDGGQTAPDWEPIGSLAWAAWSSVLLGLGGFDPAFTLLQHRYMALKLDGDNRTATHVDTAVARPAATDALTERLGQLYYPLLEEQRLLDGGN
jgi:hypothetical protein